MMMITTTTTTTTIIIIIKKLGIERTENWYTHMPKSETECE
jgi:hypothetical protein